MTFRPPSPVSIPRLMAVLLPTALSLYANFQGVQQILAPVQVEAIDPPAKVANIAMLTMICAVTGVLGLTVGGAASDATRGRWGRRAPWLVGMGALSAALTLGLGLQRGIVGVAIFYGALWFSLNCFQGALLAVTPDRVPDEKRGLASSVLGVSGPLGALVGVNLAALAPSEWGHFGLAAMLLVSTAAFVALAREAAFVDGGEARNPTRRWRMSLALLGGFASLDFSLAYGFRVLMFIAQFAIANFLLYILQDHIGVARLPGQDVQLAAGALNTLRTATTVAAIFLGYALGRRTGRRKIFAQAYAVLMAAAMLVPIVSPTWTGMLIFSALGGVATGLYSTIDLTLMSRVLPNPDSAGRDLALLVMAGASAQFVAPLFGSLCIGLLGYDALFAGAAAVTLAAGSVMFFIRGLP